MEQILSLKMTKVWKYFSQPKAPVEKEEVKAGDVASDGRPMSRKINSSKKTSVPLILPPPITVSMQIKQEEGEEAIEDIVVPVSEKEEQDKVDSDINSESDNDMEKLLEEIEKDIDELIELSELNEEEEDIDLREDENEDDELEEVNIEEIIEDEENKLLENEKSRQLIGGDRLGYKDEERKEEIEDIEDKNISNPSTLKKECPTDKKITTVKLPVLLSSVKTDISISDSITLPISVKNITKIQWKVHSFKGKAVLPSNVIFLKGKLEATIDYIGNKNTLQSIKAYIPWSNSENVRWIHEPEIPISKRNEYMFSDGESSYHSETYEKLVEEIEFELQDVRLLFQEEFKEGPGSSIHLLGNIVLTVNIAQKQYVELRI